MGILARWIIVLLAVLGGLPSSADRVAAQAISAPELTAAFLFNFVKFTTWPDDVLGGGDSIVVCVGGSDRVADALVQLTRTQRVNGHWLSIQRTNLDRPFNGCHVVYGATLDDKRAQLLISTTAGRPILTVSDSPEFAQRGGVANFFIDGDRMRFAVNPAAAERARLRISSKLLTLAKVVR